VVAGDHEVSLAVSNPCFEFWLLLHFEQYCAHLDNCDQVKKKLTRHVPGYDKTAIRFSQFADGFVDAVARARTVTEFGSEHRANPSTGVWKLVVKSDR
jgi:hypothetical protein